MGGVGFFRMLEEAGSGIQQTSEEAKPILAEGLKRKSERPYNSVLREAFRALQDPDSMTPEFFSRLDDAMENAPEKFQNVFNQFQQALAERRHVMESEAAAQTRWDSEQDLRERELTARTEYNDKVLRQRQAESEASQAATNRGLGLQEQGIDIQRQQLGVARRQAATAERGMGLEEQRNKMGALQDLWSIATNVSNSSKDMTGTPTQTPQQVLQEIRPMFDFILGPDGNTVDQNTMSTVGDAMDTLNRLGVVTTRDQSEVSSIAQRMIAQPPEMRNRWLASLAASVSANSGDENFLRQAATAFALIPRVTAPGSTLESITSDYMSAIRSVVPSSALNAPPQMERKVALGPTAKNALNAADTAPRRAAQWVYENSPTAWAINNTFPGLMGILERSGLIEYKMVPKR